MRRYSAWSVRGIIGVLLGILLPLHAQPVPPAPTFYASQNYSMYANWGSLGDVNGDGFPDLVTDEEGNITVSLGNGDGTFRALPGFNSGSYGAFQTLVEDVNGDGKADLVINGESGGSGQAGFLVCPGNGDGTFQSCVFYPAGTDSFYQVGFLTIRDFNGDGIPDVAEIGPSGVWLFAGRRDGTFATAVLTVPLEPGAIGIASADFNEDGKEDLAVTLGDELAGKGFCVLLGNGDGTFQAPRYHLTQLRLITIVAGLIGTSGHAGVVSPIDNQDYEQLYVAALFGDGKGGFSQPEFVPATVHSYGVGIADVNGDGIGDIVTFDSSAQVALGTVANTFLASVSYTLDGADSFNLALGDLRHNGLTDIAVQFSFSTSVLLNAGKGKYIDGAVTPLSSDAGCGVTGDFDSDGKPDVAVNTADGVTILLGTGEPRSPLEVGQSLAIPGTGCLNQTADLNGDGILDLILNSSTGVASLIGNGDGTFTQTSTTAVTSASPYLVLADFNRDGKLDFATAGNQIALGNGDGTFQSPTSLVSIPPTQGFSDIATGDINNDGWPDLVLTVPSTPSTNIYILINNRHGGFVQVPSNFGAGAAQVVLADLNLDGNLDLVVGADIYLGNGKGQFKLSESLNDQGVYYAFPAAVADINGDGLPDVALLAGEATLYVGLGDGTFVTPAFSWGAGPLPSYILTANLHGQRASAGVPDLVLPDTTGSVVTLINERKKLGE